jgi:hypothetical protein
LSGFEKFLKIVVDKLLNPRYNESIQTNQPQQIYQEKGFKVIKMTDCERCPEEKKQQCEAEQKAFEEMAEKYEGIFSTRLAHSRAVAISGSFSEIIQAYMAATEAIVKQMSVSPHALSEALNDYMNHAGDFPTDYKIKTFMDVKRQIAKDELGIDQDTIKDILKKVLDGLERK